MTAASGGETPRPWRRGELLLDAIYDEVDQQQNPSGAECWHCGGEGVTYDCFDGFCVDAESGCEDCTRACPECRINNAMRAKAVREAVIKSGDVDIAREWLRAAGRLTAEVTDEQIRAEMALALSSLTTSSPSEHQPGASQKEAGK